MQVDAGGYAATVDQAGAAAVAAERDGFDGWWAAETQIDPFLAATVAAERTERIQIGTGIAVAFARNPMTVALQANDVQALSGGRFLLGLGSQIKPHITKRYSMEWSRPAARMREFVLAVRAIWRAWETGEKLDFRGDFYTHTLMAPFFDPGPNPHGNPPVFLAAVGPLMTEAAGEVADGMLCHAFSTERYVCEVTLPAIERGRAKAGKPLEGFQLTAPAFVVARDSDEELEQGIAFVRQQIAFYGSTPAYRPVLELHGWGALQDDLNAKTRRGEWDSMAELIDDEVLHAFAVIGSPEEAVAELRRRYGDLTTRITLNVPEQRDEARWQRLFDQLRSGAAA
ncbi:TIGR03617 family F420-dependent LLM class oxidoreductase [Patulibacter defluvii]|uniref:TIGR03617 family F420-dependent LLM class oxidoreductase n=1 Tax=Patulibacter defluvii TaxID=3095358 RepID=UPI002A74E3CB|nr:TIGR03617 family F420-dependent LLM class oxidoreductase [Patulibacter sp. DM4]